MQMKKMLHQKRNRFIQVCAGSCIKLHLTLQPLFFLSHTIACLCKLVGRLWNVMLAGDLISLMKLYKLTHKEKTELINRLP